MRLTILLISLVLLPTLALANMSRPMTEQTQRQLSKAHACIKKGKPDCARKILSQYMKHATHPHPYGVVLYGSLLLEQNELSQATQIFEKGYKDYPQCREIVHNLAVVRYEQERFKEAGNLFLESCNLSEKPIPTIRYQASACYYQATAYELAYDAVRPLLELEKVEPNWVKLAAHSLIQRKQWTQAEKVLVRFLRLSPTEHTYWKLLANVRIEHKKYKRAAAALEIAYRIQPPTEEERRNLSQLYLYIEAPLLSAHALEDSFTSTPSAIVCDQLARAYLSAGRTEQALSMLNLAIHQDSTSARWLTKGIILYGKRHYPEAVTALQQSADLNEKTGLAHFLIGMSLWEIQQWKAAKNSFEIATRYERYAKKAKKAIKSIDSMVDNERQSRLAQLNDLL
ncbi:tetratricopeptide repeat protein [uncultured Pseudodesulfovibrio sp.]|uniref:tetratricopeptide repeat protein n=1 Tax=uncultured Pseudodesulfovibrio sp. TaxID=2035858 RepID=UPI0029C80289|nr:tetratricopeptide repeat protein [uncultured Pseudodesulfovibrio sp.]